MIDVICPNDGTTIMANVDTQAQANDILATITCAVCGWRQSPLVVEVPDVTPRQIRQALILRGVSLDSITTALATLPEPMKSLATAEWEYSVSFQRNRPLVASVGQMLGWTSAQLDALWIFAGTL